MDGRRKRVLEFIQAHMEQLAQQGTVVASFRRRANQVKGPYYRLAFREGQRQRSMYLVNDEALVAEVRAALRRIQASQHERRAFERRKKAIRKVLAQCRAELRRELERRGLRLQGYELRRWQTPGRRAVTQGHDQDG